MSDNDKVPRLDEEAGISTDQPGLRNDSQKKQKTSPTVDAADGPSSAASLKNPASSCAGDQKKLREEIDTKMSQLATLKKVATLLDPKVLAKLREGTEERIKELKSQLKNSFLIDEAFTAHREQHRKDTSYSTLETNHGEIQCVSCYGIFDPMEDYNGSNETQHNFLEHLRNIKANVDMCVQEQRDRYDSLEVNNEEFNVNTPDPSFQCILDGATALKSDLKLSRQLQNKNDGYFKFFYIDFLRKCSEALSLPVNTQKDHAKSTKKIEPEISVVTKVTNKSDDVEREVFDRQQEKRLADFVVREETGEAKQQHAFVLLKSALRGHSSGSIVPGDRAKLAIEMVNECKRSVVVSKKDRRPPLGVLAYAEGNTNWIEVFTLALTKSGDSQVWVFISLEKFETPMTMSKPETVDSALGKVLKIAIACAHIRAETVAIENWPDRIICNGLLAKKQGNGPVGHLFKPSDVTDSKNVPAAKGKPRGSKQSGQKGPVICPCAMYTTYYNIERGDLACVDLVHHCVLGCDMVRKTDRDSTKGANNSFNIESSIVMRVSALDCRSLVKMQDICLSHRCIYMERLKYVDWSKVRTDTPLSFRFCIDMCLAVATLHEINIAHSDIKSEAVMIRKGSGDGDCEFVLFDYNLGCVYADQVDSKHLHFGTSGWSHQRNWPLDFKKNDCRSLGLLLAYGISENAWTLTASD